MLDFVIYCYAKILMACKFDAKSVQTRTTNAPKMREKTVFKESIMAAETSVFFHSQLIFGESLDSYKTNVLPLHNSFFDGYVLSMKLWRVELKILNIVPLSEKTISN